MNPHSFAESLKDELFTEALHDADWLIPDGSGVVLASSLLHGSIKERVTGSDIFQGVSETLNQLGSGTVFFLGSTEETLAKIRVRMAEDYPNLVVAGTYSPPFKPHYSDEELNEMVNAINAVSPDILWVGMTAPKQEKWLFQQTPRLNVKFAAAIGAVFDFYAGNVKRSHPIFQRLHLEWLPRLIQQPRRLWRRMGVSAPIFMWHALQQRFASNEKTNP
jgi:N-acetylglucosaminyldiphosphoundecaprenol N-acetyl-beta-D-mannosaminyltransferase